MVAVTVKCVSAIIDSITEPHFYIAFQCCTLKTMRTLLKGCQGAWGWGVYHQHSYHLGLFDYLDLVPCKHNPCQNGATCTDDDRGGYTCRCSSGYGGRNCTIPCETVQLK